MKTSVSYALLWSLFYSAALWADDGAIYQTYVQQSREITQKLCSSGWASVWGDQIWAGMRHSFTADDFMTLPPELRGLMEGDGYEQGLRDCFGEDRAMKDRFTITLLVVSSAARFTGTYGAYRGISTLAGRMVAAPQWLESTRWALTQPRLVFAAGQILYRSGHSLVFLGNAMALTGLGITAFAMVCEKIEKCYSWWIRQQLPSQDELIRSGRTHDSWVAQAALQLGMQKLQAEMAELNQMPEGPATAQSRLDLKSRIESRKSKIQELSAQLGLPNPLEDQNSKSEFALMPLIAP